MLNEFRNSGLPVDKMLTDMTETIFSNPKLLETLHRPTFQNKVMSLSVNPLDAFKDGEVMEFMNDFMKVMKIN